MSDSNVELKIDRHLKYRNIYCQYLPSMEYEFFTEEYLANLVKGMTIRSPYKD